VPVLSRLIPAPLVVDIRHGAIDDLASLLADQRISTSGRLAIAISEGSGTYLRERFGPQLPGSEWFAVADSTLDAAVRLADEIRRGSYDAVVGLGGGKIIDVTKYAAARVGLPMVAVATNLSHDGICSPVSTLANDAGSGSYGVPTPLGIVVDLGVVRQAPPRTLRAGSGVVVSNLSAVADWELSHSVNGEPLDGLAISLARAAAESVIHRTDTIRDDAFLTVLAEALVLSGVSMTVAGSSRPSSGACHEICHAIDQRVPERSALHGEQVGIGAAFAWFLREDEAATRTVVDVLRHHELPVVPADLGFSNDEFVDLVAYAPRTRPGRYTIIEHLDLDDEALRKAVNAYVGTYG
jgi:glycerol-1-phosphate dehydrogenase [NAD(P)+]